MPGKNIFAAAFLCLSGLCSIPARGDQQVTVPGSFSTNMGGNWQLNLVEGTEASASAETSDTGKPALLVCTNGNPSSLVLKYETSEDIDSKEALSREVADI